MQKLSPVDRAFFLLETDERPMNVGTLVVLAPPRRGAAGFADALVRRMLQCPVGPPFNYRLRCDRIRRPARAGRGSGRRSRAAGVPPPPAAGQRPAVAVRSCLPAARETARSPPSALADARVRRPAARARRVVFQDAPRPDRRHRFHPRRARHGDAGDRTRGRRRRSGAGWPTPPTGRQRRRCQPGVHRRSNCWRTRCAPDGRGATWFACSGTAGCAAPAWARASRCRSWEHRTC